MTLHRTQYMAQVELANKKRQELWRVERTPTGWWIVTKK